MNVRKHTGWVENERELSVHMMRDGCQKAHFSLPVYMGPINNFLFA